MEARATDSGDKALNPRQRYVLEQLTWHERLDVETLVTALGVTPQTIRRDLSDLCERGLARRRHGGIARPASGHNLGIGQREQLALTAKCRIATKAVETIPDGASLMLGIGSSVAAVAEALLVRERLRILTNNLQAARVLADHAGAEVYLAEGRMRGQDLDVVGSATVAFFARHHVDIAVLGCGGLDSCGLLDFDPEEAAVSRTLLAHARHRLLVADATKWGRAAMCRIAPLETIDTFVTDRWPTLPDAREALAQAPLTLRLAGPGIS
ncbi:DeoR family transcriptional regulator [Halomonas shantousis]